MVDNTNYGTVTDTQGYFSLELPVEDPSLLVTYTGFEAQEVQAQEGQFLNVQLSEGVALEEVTVTGMSLKKQSKNEPTRTQRRL